MAKAKETVSRTLIVALVLSIVFSVVVSGAAVMLRPAQIQNQNLDIKTNILSAAGLLERAPAPMKSNRSLSSSKFVWSIWTPVSTLKRLTWVYRIR